MPSDLTGRALYVVSSGLQMDPQLHGTVQTNPVKLFSNVEDARVYARNLAKELFCTNMKSEYRRDDGYTTPDDDDFSRDGNFDQDENEDYIEFCHKGHDRRNDEEYDSGYVSVKVMYIDEEVEKQINGNKKRKLKDNNALPVNDLPPASSVPLLPKAAPASSTKALSPMPTALPPPPPFPLPSMTSTPNTAPKLYDPRYTYYNQPEHTTFPNQPNYSTTRMSGSYGQYDANAHGHPPRFTSHNQPISNVPNSYSNPIVVPDSPKMSSSNPNIMVYQPLAQNDYSMPCPSTAPAAAATIEFRQYIPPGPSMARHPSKK